MAKGMEASSYRSSAPDASGRVAYSADEHAIWATLYARQTAAIADVACDEFKHGLDLLKLSPDHIPQLPDVSARLKRETGWEVAAVPALIPFSEFFALLAAKRFPAATFIRRREHLDYLQEPDIFHELFGHTPLLTNPWFAEFTETYGRIGLAASKEDRVFLARLYWFTVEFRLIGDPNALNGIRIADERPATDGGAGAIATGNGLARDGRTQRASEVALNGIHAADERPATDGGAGAIATGDGLAGDGRTQRASEVALNGIHAADERPATDGRTQPTHESALNAVTSRNRLKIYGGGILSSPGETAYAVGPVPQRRPFDLIEVLRTPYRIDILQPLYYVLESFRDLHALTRVDLLAAVAEARRLGLHAPLFPPKPLAA